MLKSNIHEGGDTMKKLRLTTGILSIVYAAFVLFQSAAAGVYNASNNNTNGSGTVGMVVAMLMITAGVVSITTADGGIGCFVTMAVYAVAGWYGYTNAGTFTDLQIWAIWCLICALISIIGYIKAAGEAKKKVDQHNESLYGADAEDTKDE